jgi:hypothetical protein
VAATDAVLESLVDVPGQRGVLERLRLWIQARPANVDIVCVGRCGEEQNEDGCEAVHGFLLW